MNLIDKMFGRKGKNSQEITNAVFDYFKVERDGNETLATGDFADKDFTHWLQGIHDTIQRAMKTKPLRGAKIENYVSISLYIGGQKVEIAIVKDGKEGPHALLEKLKGGIEA